MAISLKRFHREDAGNVGIIFALAIVPILGLAGAALDYARATTFRHFLAKESDAAALAIANSDTPNADAVMSAIKEKIETHFGDKNAANPVQDVTVAGRWTTTSNYSMQISAKLSTAVVGIVPLMPKSVGIEARTDVTRTPPAVRFSLPNVSDLSYEAGDYNRVSVYCFDPGKRNTSTNGRRMETLTAIADNGGTVYANVVMPVCEVGETLSFQLRNVRNSRTVTANWDNKKAEHYLYFTDTTIDVGTRVLTNNVTGGREAADGTITLTDLTAAPILETIVCGNGSTLLDRIIGKLSCVSRRLGGMLPNNQETGRTPAVSQVSCAEGKYMYYGWEDRPPVKGASSDRDYDDIRVVVSCPVFLPVADKSVKIVR